MDVLVLGEDSFSTLEQESFCAVSFVPEDVRKFK